MLLHLISNYLSIACALPDNDISLMTTRKRFTVQKHQEQEARGLCN